MKNKLFAAGIFTLMFLCANCGQAQISPYVDFLQTQNTTSKDYILNLFEHYNIVIFAIMTMQFVSKFNNKI